MSAFSPFSKEELIPQTEMLEIKKQKGQLFIGLPKEKYANPSSPKKTLQTTDPEIIKQRIEALPQQVRKVVDEKFRGEYFAIEKIDSTKLL